MRKRGERIEEPGTDRASLDHLFSVTYEELRRLAASVRRGDQGATLNPTTLVHQAWIKLANSPGFSSGSQLHFKRIAARAMRQLLVESARRRHAQKRGGEGHAVFVLLDEATATAQNTDEDLLRLDAALERLARLNPRQALMVESRFFGGLEVSEIAELLEVSEKTVHRDWRAVKAWLARELRRGE